MKFLLLFALCVAMPAAFADNRTVNGVEIKPGAKIEVIFFTADDCSYCNRWKKSSRDDFLRWAEKSKVAYREVNKRRIAEPYTAAHFPPEARYAWNQVQASGKVKFLIPRWIVYADEQRVIDTSGLSDWNRVFRFVGDVVEAREQAGR